MLNRSRSLSKWKIRIRMWIKRLGMDITHQIKTRSHSRIGIGCAIFTALAMGIYLLIRSLPQLIAWLIEIVPTIEPNLVNGITLFILSFILVCPLTVGYGLVLLIGSYVFGWVGLPILYFGSLFGSWTWFILIRHLAQRWNVSARIMRYVYIYFPSLLRHHQTIEAVSLTFDSHGMKVCCLLQMGVLPFGVLNGLLALQPFVRFSPDFIVSTMVSRLKIINYIIIATSLKDVNQLLGSGERKFGLQDGIMIGRAIIFSLLSLFIIARYARKELARIQASQDLSSIQQQQPLSLNEKEEPVHHHTASSPMAARRSQTDSNIPTSSTSSIIEAPSLPFTQSTSDSVSNRPLVHSTTPLSSSFSSPPTAAIARSVYFPLMHQSTDAITCPASN